MSVQQRDVLKMEERKDAAATAVLLTGNVTYSEIHGRGQSLSRMCACVCVCVNVYVCECACMRVRTRFCICLSKRVCLSGKELCLADLMWVFTSVRMCSTDSFVFLSYPRQPKQCIS